MNKALPTDMEIQGDWCCAYIKGSVLTAVIIFAGKTQAEALVMEQHMLCYNNTRCATTTLVTL